MCNYERELKKKNRIGKQICGGIKDVFQFMFERIASYKVDQWLEENPPSISNLFYLNPDEDEEDFIGDMGEVDYTPAGCEAT